MSRSPQPGPGITPQLPLTLRYPPDQRFDSFVAAPEAALAQLRLLAENPGADWLYLAGAAKTGKTHLALALCAAAEQAGRRAVYLPMVAAVGRTHEALEALEGNDVVALDGLEAAAGMREDEVALFDFHNRARSAGLNVLYTARGLPDEIGLTLPDLRSRLSQCARVVLPALDDEGRREVLRDRAQRRGLILEEAAIDWLLIRTDRDLGNLIGILEILDRESLAAQRRVTVPFLRSVLEAR
ncbi:DnaA regulatory inactivator Hda [Pseudoxanthomonas sp. UTMC 1351]|uniref:DnaA regulatory inactivator Hda n=1 Tax=Pseudoxanthomonas sp. UTMC 1351 TaxID=2695853 RepID=UPI0034CF9848